MNLQFDTLPQGLLVTLIGMMIVFLGLVVLIILISLISRLTGGIGTKKDKSAPAPAQYTPASTPAAEIDEELMAVISAAVAAADQDELIAVISAAIAMMDGGSNLGVRRVRRISNASAWNKAGREEQVYSRY